VESVVGFHSSQMIHSLSVTQMKKLEAAHHKFQCRLLGISWNDKVKNDDIKKKTGLWKLRDIIKEHKTKMVGTCPTNGGLQNTSPDYTDGVERIQEEARTTRDKLDRNHEMQPEKYGHQLGGSQGTGG